MAKHLVIMAGGIGSRFWPKSTLQCPKQFLDITDCGRTLIQQTYDRFQGVVDIAHVWVVTSRNYKDLVQEQLAGINIQHILLEPCMRNTAPCIAYASWKIKKEDPSADIVVAPSDHLVLNVDSFQRIIRKAFNFIERHDAILTLGMKPSSPNTGYGYIEHGNLEKDEFYKVSAFHEKPNLRNAIGYVQRGNFSWNSGLFMWNVDVIISELRIYSPQIAQIMDRILPSMFTMSEQSLLAEHFPCCEKISIDYAIMEKSHKVYVLPAEFGWSDLGTWESLYTISVKDNNKNVVKGSLVKMIESSECIIDVPNNKTVVAQGLNGYIIAEHKNTLLICKREDEQRIKEWHN